MPANYQATLDNIDSAQDNINTLSQALAAANTLTTLTTLKSDLESFRDTTLKIADDAYAAYVDSSTTTNWTTFRTAANGDDGTGPNRGAADDAEDISGIPIPPSNAITNAASSVDSAATSLGTELGSS